MSVIDLYIEKVSNAVGDIPSSQIGPREHSTIYSSPTVSNPALLDDTSKSPRAMTPDRSGNEDKDKRKKRVTT